MSLALITQIKNMKDEEIQNVYQAMKEKCARLLLRQQGEGSSLDIIDKLIKVKQKYSYVEAEISARKLQTPVAIASIDIAALKSAEEEKIKAIIARYDLDVTSREVL